MARPKTTLVLGAGASFPYGFPVGTGLRAQILREAGKESFARDVYQDRTRLRQFAEAFGQSQLYSIDAFLGRRADEFGDIGKRLIAHVLLSCESTTNLFFDHEDHWYRYLVNVLGSEPWDEFDPSWLSVVTFNYDRSLEHYLYATLQSQYGKSATDVANRLKSLQIVHVYGSLGEVWGDTADSIPFGGHRPDHIAGFSISAANRLKVIPEGRDDGPTLTAARALVSGAERIAFLGFGFDATNVRRLGGPSIAPSPGQKTIVGTALGLTDSEVRRAMYLLVGPTDAGYVTLGNRLRCTDLLRQTLILE